jgi:WD40 repeat protein
VRRRRAVGRPLRSHTGFINSVAFSADGRRIASAADTTVKVWDADVVGNGLRNPSQTVWVAISPDDRTLAAADAGGAVTLWDIARGRRVGRLAPEFEGTNFSEFTFDHIAFARDGRTLALAGGDSTVRLWDVKRQRPLGESLRGHTASVTGVAFSPDGRTLASAGADKTVRLWDVEDHRQLGAPLRGHTDAVSSVAFSPDGHRLASGSQDRTLRLWDIRSGSMSGPPLGGHTEGLVSAVFSPDGRTLASSSNDGTVRLWDVERRRLLGAPLPAAVVGNVTFSQDGRMLAYSADEDIALIPRFWWNDITQARARLCSAAGRNLSSGEWREFLPDEPYRRTCPRSPNLGDRGP